MSQELVKQEPEESGFASQGFDSFPSLYGDGFLLHELADYILDKNDNAQPRFTTERITEWAIEYHNFLQRDDLMPRAREQADHHLRHLLFERAWRTGYFVKAPDDASGLEV